jgi:hypothetical protein
MGPTSEQIEADAAYLGHLDPPNMTTCWRALDDTAADTWRDGHRTPWLPDYCSRLENHA